MISSECCVTADLMDVDADGTDGSEQCELLEPAGGWRQNGSLSFLISCRFTVEMFGDQAMRWIMRFPWRKMILVSMRGIDRASNSFPETWSNVASCHGLAPGV